MFKQVGPDRWRVMTPEEDDARVKEMLRCYKEWEQRQRPKHLLPCPYKQS